MLRHQSLEEVVSLLLYASRCVCSSEPVTCVTICCFSNAKSGGSLADLMAKAKLSPAAVAFIANVELSPAVEPISEGDRALLSFIQALLRRRFH